MKSTSKEAAEEDNGIQQLISEMFADDDQVAVTSKLVGSDTNTTKTAKAAAVENSKNNIGEGGFTPLCGVFRSMKLYKLSMLGQI